LTIGLTEPVHNEELFSVDSDRTTEADNPDMFAGTEGRSEQPDTDDASGESGEEASSMAYGRSRYRRSEKSESADEQSETESAPSTGPEETETAPVEATSSEPISFGRRPRKRLKK
jgi:hypothetical protein